MIFSYVKPYSLSLRQLIQHLQWIYANNFAFQAWCGKPSISADKLFIQLKYPRANDNYLFELFTFLHKLTPCSYRANYTHFLQRLDYFKVNDTAAIIAFDKITTSTELAAIREEVKPLFAALTLGIIKKYSTENYDNQYSPFEVKQYGAILYVDDYEALHQYFFCDNTILPEDIDALEIMPEEYNRLLVQNEPTINATTPSSYPIATHLPSANDNTRMQIDNDINAFLESLNYDENGETEDTEDFDLDLFTETPFPYITDSAFPSFNTDERLPASIHSHTAMLGTNSFTLYGGNQQQINEMNNNNNSMNNVVSLDAIADAVLIENNANPETDNLACSHAENSESVESTHSQSLSLLGGTSNEVEDYELNNLYPEENSFTPRVEIQTFSEPVQSNNQPFLGVSTIHSNNTIYTSTAAFSTLFGHQNNLQTTDKTIPYIANEHNNTDQYSIIPKGVFK